MKEYIRDLTTILNAFETISLVGYKNCQTYSNCMLALSKVINLMSEEDGKNIETVEAEEETIKE